MNGVMALAARGAGGSEMVKRVRRILGIKPYPSPQSTWHSAVAVTSILIATMFVACKQALAPKSGEVINVPGMQEIIRQSRLSEAAIHNLKVEEFEMTEEFKPDGATEWQKTPLRTAGTAWYGDPKDGMFRMNISQEVLKWVPSKGEEDKGVPGMPPGTPPFAETTYDIGFDGKDGREVQSKSGWLGHSIAQPFARINPGARPAMDSRYHHFATGAAFSMSYAQMFNGRSDSGTLSTQLEKGISRGAKPNFVMTKLDGHDAIQLSSGRDNENKSTVWFDPHHGYAVVARESVMSGKIQDSMHITRFAEVASGVWYPMNAYQEWRTLGRSEPQGLHRYIYSAKKAVANDPDFDQGIFKIFVSSTIQTNVERIPVAVPLLLPPVASDAKGKLEQSNRSKSAANLKTLGGVIGLYGNDHNGVYPPDLATAVKVEEMGGESLKSPMGDENVGFDYVYLHYKGMIRPIAGDLVVAYDAPDAAKNGGACVLFSDGNVRWLDAVKLKAALGRTEAVRPRS